MRTAPALRVLSVGTAYFPPVESFERRHGVFSPGELCVLGNWEFTEPLDLDRAVAVEIGEWHIPLTGPEAGVVRPK